MVKRTRNKKLNIMLTENERDFLHKVAKEQNTTITDLILKLFKEIKRNEI